MSSTIWETVAANQLQIGDILVWYGDYSLRVKIDDIRPYQGAEVLPYVDVHVHGSPVQFERGHGMSTGRTYRQGDAVIRMRPERAARVGDNFRSVVRAS